MPGLPLPPNPIAEEFVAMPYLRLEQVTNSEFSFSFQNYWFVAVGGRWMPFRNYKWRDNEWLYKTKLFVEYVGVGGVYNTRQGPDRDPTAPNDWDLRFGINFSSRRF